MEFAKHVRCSLPCSTLHRSVLPQDIALHSCMLMNSRLTGHSLLHWRLAWLHRGRSRSFSRLRMASNSQHPGYCSGLSLRWIPPGSIWQTLHRPLWVPLYLHWVCPCCLRPQLRSADCWNGSLRSGSCHWRTDWPCWVRHFLNVVISSTDHK